MADVSNNNVLSYPTMTRQRADKIQAKEIAYAEDVNAEFDHIVDTYNRLVLLLTGEWGDGTGRIYDLVDNAVSLANSAIAKANDCVQKSGDTMTGQLNIALVPSSDYNVVNKKYVDDTIDAELSGPVNRIQQLEDWKENLNATQVKLDNVNFASNNVNDGMNELFISVSSGKATVAAAITGKGIQTASDASFKQMADNINAILTFNEGTSGGTATAEDIMYGKTAYARGGLIVGSYIPLDLTDATATSDKILEGYTAYVGGGKIIGTYVPPRDYPIYGTDTSNATATAADILYGKTAYARGQYLIGTMQNTDVEEVYGVSNVEPYNISKSTYATDTPPDGQPACASKVKVCFSKDGNFSVSLITVNTDSGTKYYIESLGVNDKGMYYQASSGGDGNVTYKKYRYSLEELGIGTDETIQDICLGAPGFGGSATKCVLAILSTKVIEKITHTYIRLYTYHLSDGGLIGKTYTGEDVIEHVHEITDKNYKGAKICGSNLDWSRFYVASIGYNTSSRNNLSIDILKIIPTTNNYNVIYTNGVPSYYASYGGVSLLKTTNDDIYLVATSKNGSTGDFMNTVFSLDNDNSPTSKVNLSFETLGIIAGNMCITVRESPSDTTGKNRFPIYIYNIIKSPTFNLEKLKTIYINDTRISKEDRVQMCSYMTPDNKNFIISINKSNATYLAIIDVDAVLAAEDGAEIQFKQFTLVNPITLNAYVEDRMVGNSDGTRIQFYRTASADYMDKIGLYTATNKIDTENIVGLKYKGEYYMKQSSNGLTASAGDVVKSKIFIGSKGVPETGTMEV